MKENEIIYNITNRNTKYPIGSMVKNNRLNIPGELYQFFIIISTTPMMLMSPDGKYIFDNISEDEVNAKFALIGLADETNISICNNSIINRTYNVI